MDGQTGTQPASSPSPSWPSEPNPACPTLAFPAPACLQLPRPSPKAKRHHLKWFRDGTTTSLFLGDRGPGAAGLGARSGGWSRDSPGTPQPSTSRSSALPVSQHPLLSQPRRPGRGAGHTAPHGQVGGHPEEGAGWAPGSCQGSPCSFRLFPVPDPALGAAVPGRADPGFPSPSALPGWAVQPHASGRHPALGREEWAGPHALLSAQDCLRAIVSSLGTLGVVVSTLISLGLVSTASAMLLSAFLWFAIHSGCNLDRRGKYTLGLRARGCRPQEPRFSGRYQQRPAAHHPSKADALRDHLGPSRQSGGPRLLQDTPLPAHRGRDAPASSRL
ncbi:tetraspanin-32 isoform X1 [Vicugna pacos]|uniref:Tetraspanin-32 isoform X1 n=1 Tax=Vicugna pacos TaxID=30538 RepID=A0ABM5E0G7_VICPA